MKQGGSDRVEELRKFKKKVREAVAKYMSSEGCSCCQNVEDHKKHTAELAKLLNVKMYDDKSGYNFNQYIQDNK